MGRPKLQPNSGETSAQTLPSPTTTTSIETPNQNDQTQLTSQSQNQSPTMNVTIRLPVVTLILRLITLVSLIISLIIITSDTTTLTVAVDILTSVLVKIHFHDVYTYRYMVWCIGIGLAYTCLQVPLAIYRVSMGKPLINHPGLLKFDFFSDKGILCLLATGVGAAFGVTMDLKKAVDHLDDLRQQRGDMSLSQNRSKYDSFFNMGNVSAAFLLIGFLSSGVSSILSSLCLSKK